MGQKIDNIEINVEANVEDAVNKIEVLTEALENMAESLDNIAPRITLKNLRDCDVTVNVHQPEPKMFVQTLSNDIEKRAEEIRKDLKWDDVVIQPNR